MAGTYIELPATSGGGSSFITNIVDSDSVDLSVAVGFLSADVNISTNVATGGFFKATTTIQNSGSKGIHVELPIATTSLTGVISSTDWNTFNAKEPAISSGTTSQYWRGDKSFQTLNVAALLAVTDGSLAGVGVVGQIQTSTQATNTTTGVAATGTFGNVTSLSLTAGSYLVFGTVGFDENGAVLTDGFSCGISASATGVGLSEFDTNVSAYLISSTLEPLLNTPPVVVNISSTTTYYLNSKFGYSSGTPRHRGRITAWRIR